MNLYELLANLNIEYEEISHKEVFTVEDAKRENISGRLEGIECKNLFVKNKKHYFLIFAKCSRNINLKELSNNISEPRFSFAKEDELKRILKLNMGGVSPLGVINDEENIVTLLIDKDIKNNDKVLVHSNTNNKTISILFEDLLKILKYTSHKYYTF